MICCETPYNQCEPIPQCTDSIVIFVPLTYDQESISIQIVNGQGIGRLVELDVLNNSVEIDVTDWVDGFFNPYSGMFTLKFFDSIDLSKPIEFIAVDGKTYNSATFGIKKVSSATGIIDLFGYEDTGY